MQNKNVTFEVSVTWNELYSWEALSKIIKKKKYALIICFEIRALIVMYLLLFEFHIIIQCWWIGYTNFSLYQMIIIDSYNVDRYSTSGYKLILSIKLLIYKCPYSFDCDKSFYS